jgi:hypothetical protein
MTLFSEDLFRRKFDFAAIEQTVDLAITFAAQDPLTLYLFFQRYSHFNGYASAAIARLVSSIGLSRYLFTNSELLVTEEADRGMDIAAQVMSAAADEGAENKPVHRALAQLTVKTVGDYANLSADQRNAFATIPDWLKILVKDIVAKYEGTPGDAASLMRGMGVHAASEFLGDIEYSLIDKVIRHDNRGSGFDQYLRKGAKPAMIQGHKYSPWAWVVIHSMYEHSAAEADHMEYALNALNMSARYLAEPEQQIMTWVMEGFTAFVELQQQLFLNIHRECQELSARSSQSSGTNFIYR